MKHAIQASLATAIMLIIALFVAVLFGGAFMFKQHSKSPADLLPREHTVLYIHNPTYNTLELWTEKFPILERLNIVAGTVGIAVLEQSGEQSRMIFREEENHLGNEIIGGYRIEGREEDIALLRSPERRLSNIGLFQHAKRNLETVSWALVRTNSLPTKNTPFDGIIDTLLYGDSEHVAIGFAPKEIIILRSTEKSSPAVTLKPIPTLASLLSFSDLPDTISSLSTDTQTLLLGRMEKLLTHFGNDISLAYDILPLFESPSAIMLQGTGSNVSFLAMGSHSDTATLKRTFNRLHTSYANSITPSAIKHRVLDDRFSTTDIRLDNEAITKSKREVDGRLLQATHLKENDRGLFTEIRDKEFRISNDRNLHTKTMNVQKVPAKKHTGVVYTATLDALLPAFFTAPYSQFLEIPEHRVQWESTQDGSIRKIVIGSIQTFRCENEWNCPDEQE